MAIETTNLKFASINLRLASLSPRSAFLAKVISSNSFYENVLNSGYYVNKNYFGQTIKAQMKIWSKTVSAKAVNGTGIISLDVYHTDRSQAEMIARAVAYTLQAKNGLYHGGGDNVSIKIIDEPITSNYPVKPNIIFNFSLALVLGLIFAGMYIYLFPEEKYNIKLSPKVVAPEAEADSLPEEPEFASAVFETVAAPVEENFTVAENNFAENLNEIKDNNFPDYDDLDIREEIAKQGNMKNIF